MPKVNLGRNLLHCDNQSENTRILKYCLQQIYIKHMNINVLTLKKHVNTLCSEEQQFFSPVTTSSFHETPLEGENSVPLGPAS